MCLKLFYCKKGSSLDTQVRLKRSFKIIFYSHFNICMVKSLYLFELQVSECFFALHVQLCRMVDRCFYYEFSTFSTNMLAFSYSIFYSIYLSLSITHTNTSLIHKLLNIRIGDSYSKFDTTQIYTNTKYILKKYILKI